MQYLWFILLFSDDLSFEKIASQSHSYPVLGSLYSANNAVDWNTTICSRTSGIGYASRFKNVWWKVDLGRVHNLYNMGILFKSYDGYGMYTYNPNNRKKYHTCPTDLILLAKIFQNSYYVLLLRSLSGMF